ncbi:hypothetical protein GQR58_026728 [Nymphon striatum]|nr:hypothetical protein GQR58_026728 [Nymphon striatum]
MLVNPRLSGNDAYAKKGWPGLTLSSSNNSSHIPLTLCCTAHSWDVMKLTLSRSCPRSPVNLEGQNKSNPKQIATKGFSAFLGIFICPLHHTKSLPTLDHCKNHTLGFGSNKDGCQLILKVLKGLMPPVTKEERAFLRRLEIGLQTLHLHQTKVYRINLSLYMEELVSFAKSNSENITFQEENDRCSIPTCRLEIVPVFTHAAAEENNAIPKDDAIRNFHSIASSLDVKLSGLVRMDDGSRGVFERQFAISFPFSPMCAGIQWIMMEHCSEVLSNDSSKKNVDCQILVKKIFDLCVLVLCVFDNVLSNYCSEQNFYGKHHIQKAVFKTKTNGLAHIDNLKSVIIASSKIGTMHNIRDSPDKSENILITNHNYLPVL